ncbi:MAG: polysaccharide biosynthesis C-terminal domain-containing protein, partial [Anaerolineae bacterium]|nr:polysaccharide biosynthesis C-terminal domain-containing protein [Anaerolineae bacterium]
GLILLGRPLLSFLYQRGQFDAAAVDAVYTTLRFFALGLIAHTCLELTARAFFAQKDTVTPLVVATGSAVTNILLAILLMGVLGAGGLALANTLAVTAEVLVLMVILRKRWGGVEGRLIGRTFVRAGMASAVMGLMLVVFIGRAESAGLGNLVLVALGGLLGLAVYIVAGLLFGVRELREMPAALLGR